MYRPLTFVILAAFLSACGEASPPPPAGSARPIAMPPPASANVSATGPSLADWRNRLDQLLPAADIAELAGMPPDAMPDVGRPDHLRYTWDAGRTFEYAGTRVKKRSLISIGPIRTGSTVEAFAALHFNPPDERHRARLKEEVTRQAERRNLDEQSTAVAHRLADGFASRKPAERIEGLGDAAAWATDGGDPTLYVLVGGSTVTLVVNVADDPAANRITAEALARRAIERATGDLRR
jgi:hypothetical protein